MLPQETAGGRPRPPRGRPMFAFFSDRLGCLGSVVVSLVGTAALLSVMWLLSR